MKKIEKLIENPFEECERELSLSGDIHYLVGELRFNGNYTLGVLLTAVEAALGDSKQAEALKAIVRREMFYLMDRDQGTVYEMSGEQAFGVKPKMVHIDGQDGNDLA